MARYTLLRLLIFFGFLLLFWLLGLRTNPVLLLGAAAIASAAMSYILLRGMRDEMTAQLVARHEARLAAKGQTFGDEAVEDAEIGGTESAHPDPAAPKTAVELDGDPRRTDH